MAEAKAAVALDAEHHRLMRHVRASIAGARRALEAQEGAVQSSQGAGPRPASLPAWGSLLAALYLNGLFLP
jgi:hypothetical protein